MPDEILTLPDVARLLKVADKTVYTMAQEAQLPAAKVRGQWRFNAPIWTDGLSSTRQLCVALLPSEVAHESP